MAAILRLTSLSSRLGDRLVLDGIDVALEPGRFVVVVGPNGAGKSSLLNVIAGLRPATGGLDIAGGPAERLSPRERAMRIAYMPQGHEFHWPMPVADIVALGRYPHGLTSGRVGAGDEAAIARAVAATDIADLLDRPVTALSGGEKARVSLARALAVEAPILMADEPIASLDPAHQLRVMDLLHRTAANGALVIAVLHDLPLAVRFADDLLVLDHGRMVAFGEPHQVVADDILDRVFGIRTERVRVGDEIVPLPWERRT